MDIVQILLSVEEDRIPDVNAETSQETEKTSCLQEASALGNLEIVNYLLEHGANVDQQNSKGKTALHRAVYKKQKEVVKLLIDCGADVNLEDNTERTPLHWAGTVCIYFAVLRHWTAFFGYYEIAKMLVDGGADLVKIDKTKKRASQIAKSKEFYDVYEIVKLSDEIENEQPQQQTEERPAEDALQL